MPVWLWLLVIGGLGYGLFEVGLRERRSARARGRRLHRRAVRVGFTPRAREHHRELTRLLVLIPDLERPADVGPLFDGQLADGTPVTVFDFVEQPEGEMPRARVGFVLDYPTEWPTISLSAAGMHALAASGIEHDFSRSLLASSLCDYLAARPDWIFAFSGPHAFGATDQQGDDDLDHLLAMARGVAGRLPSDLITRWAALPAHEQSERRAS